jgi:hypothetical protein
VRTIIERVDARSNVDVRSAIERWKTMRRVGWTLSVVHRYKPEPTLTAFGSAPTDGVPSIESLERDATSDASSQLALFASDSPER